ncbi:MAG TPA: hypothetical protein GXX65_06390 [Methanosarcina sp.]|nr:hypothetical protein [Methanosarcina sp.]
MEKLPDIEEQNRIIESNIEKEIEQVGNTSVSQRAYLSTPGFEIIYCIFGLLGAFLYRR